MDRSMLCSFYFRLGLNYSEILSFLAQIHGVCISMRTETNTALSLDALRCLQHGLIVSRDTVGILMQLLDPAGIQLRLRRRLRGRQISLSLKLF
ncbi:hypothetical protein ACJMK2_000372 [Sinanodonta woodiana]|uniref:Uncharacterized protein n=1 Tax=Sinanodonta woodiana TaxID=1069815 RepID=A0ABD3XP20_SINWO